MILAIDLDGTAWEEDWPHIGLFKKNFIRVMRRLWDEGHFLIIYSMREKGTKEYDDAVDHLEIKNIKYHLFNENNPELIEDFGEARKISAAIYIDDRGLRGIPDDWEEIYNLIVRHPKYDGDRTSNFCATRCGLMGSEVCNTCDFMQRFVPDTVKFCCTTDKAYIGPQTNPHGKR